MTDGRCTLKVDGQVFEGWHSIRVTRSMERLAGDFELEFSEAWPRRELDTIAAGKACQVFLDDEPVITGYIDDEEPTYDDRSHGVRVAGRDRTADLVDCSAIYKSGQWRGATLERIARDLCEPFGIEVRAEVSVGAAFPSHKADPGETVFEVLEKAARQRGVLLTSNAAGDLVITRAAQGAPVAELIEGRNILAAHAQFSWRERFRDYTVLGQHKGDDSLPPDLTAQAKSTSHDAGVTRYRPLVVLAETGAGTRERANWERSVRAGRARRATISVEGWRHAGGDLWQPNTTVRVRSPWIKIDGELLVCACTYSLDDRGARTELTVTPRDAFVLDPTLGKAAGRTWGAIQ